MPCEPGSEDLIYTMPDTIEECLEILGKGGGEVEDIARKFGAWEQCSHCPEYMVQTSTLEEQLAEFYGLEEMPEIYALISNGGVFVDHINHFHLCDQCGGRHEADK